MKLDQLDKNLEQAVQFERTDPKHFERKNAFEINPKKDEKS